jgi:hypothetical protein
VCAFSSHTPEETNAVARAMLERAAFGWNDNLADGGPWMGGGEPPVTWNGFLGRGEVDGWSQQARKEAFAWYLSTLGTNDCTSLTTKDRELVRTALFECRTLNFVEAAPSLKALALNPNGIYRSNAIRLAIQFSPVDDSVTAFAETIMTNTVGCTRQEYGAASCQYAQMLLDFNATNDMQRTVRDRAVNMFYRNRMLPSAAYSIVDGLFVRYISGYETSSNRLKHALNVLSMPIYAELSGEHFTSVTNQLLSSGRPLVPLDIGGGGD